MIFSFVENKVTRVLFSVDFISGISGFKGYLLCSLIILSQPSPNYSIYSTLARTFVIVGFLEYCSEIFHTSVLRVHLQLAKSLSNFKPTKNSTAIPKSSINAPSSKQSSHTYMAIQIKPLCSGQFISMKWIACYRRKYGTNGICIYGQNLSKA